jgi:hypothetical protein
MSESFLIKKTAFDVNGDLNERNDNSFIIGPGELNGPAGVLRDSDLRLYGFGSLKWGEGVNQNLFRILENSACAEKETGDFLVGTDDPVGFVPGTGNFNASIHATAPKDENDLGLGNGITTPVVGQDWYNTTSNLKYVYKPTGWDTAGAGGFTVGGDLDMGGKAIQNVQDPTDLSNVLPASVTAPGDAVTVGWADERYINATGDAMTGSLDLGGYKITTLGNPTISTDALTLGYADGRYLSNTGGLLYSDIQFTIPAVGSSSDGIYWSGNTDFAKIYTKTISPETTKLIFQVGDNGLTDYISFEINDYVAGITEVLKVGSVGITPLVPITMGGQNITSAGTVSATNITTPTVTLSGTTNGSLTSSVLRLKSATNGTYDYTDILGGYNGLAAIRMTSNDNWSTVYVQGNTPAGGVPYTIASFYANATTRYLNMNGNKITQLATATSGLDAANKNYVDAAITAANQIITVVSGTIAHNGTIPLPSGYTHSQCTFMVGAGTWPTSAFGGYGRDGIDSFYVSVDKNTRVVSCYTVNSASYPGTANYILIGIK